MLSGLASVLKEPPATCVSKTLKLLAGRGNVGMLCRSSPNQMTCLICDQELYHGWIALVGRNWVPCWLLTARLIVWLSTAPTVQLLAPGLAMPIA